MRKTVSERAIAPVAIGAIALATTLAALGTYAGSDEQGTKEFLVVCAIIAVAAAVVFGWVVPRGLQREAAGATALTLSILGLVTVARVLGGTDADPRRAAAPCSAGPAATQIAAVACAGPRSWSERSRSSATLVIYASDSLL